MYYQQGGQQGQMMQILKAYAQAAQIDPRKLMQQLQQMNPQEQQAAIQQMAEALQGESNQQEAEMAFGGYIPESPFMKNGGSTFSGNAWYANGGAFNNMYQYAGQVSLDPELSQDPYNTYQEQTEDQDSSVPNWHKEWENDPLAVTSSYPEINNVDTRPLYMDDVYGPNASNTPAPSVPTSAVTPTRSSSARTSVYNPSIVDFLNSQGFASDYNTRKQIAKDLGISNYRGTADQNVQMLEGVKQSLAGQAGQGAPGQTGPVNPGGADGAGGDSGMTYDPTTGSWVPTAVTLGSVGAAGGLGYYAYRQAYKNPAGAAASAKSVLSGLGKDDMIKAIKTRGYRLPTDYDDLVRAGWKPNEIMKQLKGTPFNSTVVKNQAAALKQQAAAQAAAYKNVGNTQNARIADLANDNLSTFANDLKNVKASIKKDAKPIIEEILKRGVREADDFARLQKIGLSTAEAQAVLKGLKFSKQALNPTPSIVPATRSFGQAARQGYAALRGSSALANITKGAKAIGKYLPFEEGGEYYMQEGGWNVGDYHIPDWLKTGVQVLDPTGVSSYGDVYDAWRDPNTSAWEAGFETLAALPVVGKFGKAAKATSKLGKVMNKVDNLAKYVSPVAYMDRKLAPNAAFASMMGKRAAGKNPVAGALMNMGSFSNQGRRFFTGAEAGVGAMDNMMQYTPQKANGGMVGQEMDVTPEELEMLRAQGYQFEII